MIILLASQALALAAPVAQAPVPRGAHVSALATVEILQAETTRADAGPRALKRHRLTGAERGVSIGFE